MTTTNINAAEYLKTKATLEQCEERQSGGSVQFDGYVTEALVQALTEAGFVRAREDEGFHTDKLAMECFKKDGWTANITQANFMGRFTQVEIRRTT